MESLFFISYGRGEPRWSGMCTLRKNVLLRNGFTPPRVMCYRLSMDLFVRFLLKVIVLNKGLKSV